MARRRNTNACTWCRRPMISHDGYTPIRDGRTRTRDHKYPKRLGGTKTVPCCYACNQVKGGMDLREWFDFMSQNPKWWRLWPFSIPRREEQRHDKTA